MENRTKIALLTILLLAVSIRQTMAQDMNYTQYFSAPIYYNPAYTGINEGLRARFLYRNQWPALPVSFKSYHFSADLGDRNLPGAGGIGLVVNQDSPGYGLIRNFAASITVGVRVLMRSNVVMQVGIKAGILQRNINWNDLVFPSQLDPYQGIVGPFLNNQSEVNKILVADFGAGGAVQFLTGNEIISGNIGLAVDHLFQPDVSFFSNGASPYPRKWIGQMDLLFNLGPGGRSSSGMKGMDDSWKINVGAIYQNQANLGALQVGLNGLIYNVYIGAWYKTTFGLNPNNALALVAGYRYYFYENMSIKLIYSYDIQISRAMQGTGGAHEISLIIDLADITLFGSSGRGGNRGYAPGGTRRGGSGFECPTF